MGESRIEQMLTNLRAARQIGIDEKDMCTPSRDLSIAIAEIETAILRLTALHLGEAIFHQKQRDVSQ